MTDLTDKWKKGELETNKYYYVRDISYILPAKLGRYDNQLYFSGNEVGYGYEENRELEVLAPVPSYEEWQASENYIDYLKQCISVYESKDKQATETSLAYGKLLEENAQLKELLKECSPYISEWDTPMNILARIDEVLGEKEC